jgi:hypothetical protein
MYNTVTYPPVIYNIHAHIQFNDDDKDTTTTTTTTAGEAVTYITQLQT